MLSFIGIGNAFSYQLGNCSAFYKENDSMLLIDCGESVFESILSNKLLDEIQNLYILITHFHSDHVGSLGSMMFYCDKIGIKDVNIMYPDLDKLNQLIEIFGVNKCNYKLIRPSDLGIVEISQSHSFMQCYGYVFQINGKTIYYSGDTKIVPDFIVNMLVDSEIDCFYQDVRIKENDYHISLAELVRLIPENHRGKVKCMHYSCEEVDEITEKGFSIVKKFSSYN